MRSPVEIEMDKINAEINGKIIDEEKRQAGLAPKESKEPPEPAEPLRPMLAVSPAYKAAGDFLLQLDEVT